MTRLCSCSPLHALRVGALVFGCALGCRNSQVERFPYTMTERQRAVADSLVHANPGWRLATDMDSHDQTSLREMRSRVADFSPYFASRGDSPAERDFAIALVRDTVFRVFYSRFEEARYALTREVTKVDWLGHGLLRIRGDTLDVAPFRSDEVFSFYWRSSSRQLELLPLLPDTGD